MKKNLLLFIAFISLLSACIGDDIIEDEVAERLVITNPLDSIRIDTSYQFEATFFNNVGQMEERTINWLSTDEEILSIDANGLATSHAIGDVTIIASVTLDDNTTLDTDIPLTITENETVISEPDNERSGQIQTTTFYILEGDFVLRAEADELVLEIAENWQASSGLPGLYLYLTNNPNTTNGALEIGKVEVFNGAHSYTIPDVGINDYSHLLYFCKPFNVKVGDGEIQ